MDESPQHSDELLNQLDEKNQLIAALTERLELAAEQLDRNHRNGSDRGVRTSGVGLPPELIEQQQTLASEMHHFVEQWDEMQPGATLGRIELQVSELRDFIAQRLDNLRINASPVAHATREPAAGGREQTTAPEKQQTVAPQGSSSYEHLKAQLMGEPAQPAANVPATDHHDAPAMVPALDHLPEAPAPVEFETASPEDLQRAVMERDQYIAQLIQEMRSSHKERLLSSDWKELESVPHDLHATLCELQADLNKTLRLAEVEFSLERARMGREANQIKQARAELEREMRHHSINTGESKAGDEEDSAGFTNRWRRLMGKN